MSYHTKIQQIAVASLAFGLAACQSDLAGPGADAFDPEATSTDLAAVSATYETEAFQSLEVLGGSFTVPGAVLASEAASLIVSASPANTSGLNGRVLTVSADVQQALAQSMAPLIPSQWLGTTLTWNGEGYAPDEARTDGPANGIRFILYAIDPVTHKIAEPLTEIGYADILDVGGANSSAVQLVVVSGDVTYVDYTVTATGVFNAPVITVEGYLTDGTTRVDFLLSHAAQATIASQDVQIDYQIDIEDRDFSLTLHLDLSHAGETSTSALDVAISHGPNVVTVVGEVTNEIGSLEVSGNGEVFAIIHLTETGIEVVNPNGEPLTERQTRALREVWHTIEHVFDVFEDLFRPVAWLFNIGN